MDAYTVSLWQSPPFGTLHYHRLWIFFCSHSQQWVENSSQRWLIDWLMSERITLEISSCTLWTESDNRHFEYLRRTLHRFKLSSLRMHLLLSRTSKYTQLQTMKNRIIFLLLETEARILSDSRLTGQERTKSRMVLNSWTQKATEVLRAWAKKITVETFFSRWAWGKNNWKEIDPKCIWYYQMPE